MKEQFVIVITSYRHRWADPDGLAGCKWMVDEINRNTDLFPDDSGKYIEFVMKKVVKISKKESERTTIEVYQSQLV